ncbi:MAG TPA: zinc ribbon domain-containing protein [Casimicrobiaceae bacterium]
MICASCGRQNPAGAHYCIHCGAEQSVPTPIAAVAAASTAVIARSSRARAANAAQAEPAIVAPLRPANPMPSDDNPPRADGASSAEPPAYDALPRRPGLAVALIAGCVVVAFAAIAGWYLYGGAHSDAAADDAAERGASVAQRDDAMKGESAPGAANAPSAATAAVSPSGGAETAAADRVADAASAGAGASRAAESAPIEIRQLPARPAAARQPRRPPPERAAAPAAAAAAPERTPAPAPRTPVAAAPAAVAPVSDRWTRMNDEMSRCTREDFIARVICSQRVRFRYCDGYWGKVEQCPASPPPERGQ